MKVANLVKNFQKARCSQKDQTGDPFVITTMENETNHSRLLTDINRAEVRRVRRPVDKEEESVPEQTRSASAQEQEAALGTRPSCSGMG